MNTQLSKAEQSLVTSLSGYMSTKYCFCLFSLHFMHRTHPFLILCALSFFYIFFIKDYLLPLLKVITFLYLLCFMSNKWLITLIYLLSDGSHFLTRKYYKSQIQIFRLTFFFFFFNVRRYKTPKDPKSVLPVHGFIPSPLEWRLQQCLPGGMSEQLQLV